MPITLEILRRESAADAPHWECYPFEPADGNETVATALHALNAQLAAEGKAPVRWECSCMQKKCGACAMVIANRPCLACDAKLRDVQKDGRVRIEPLRKFPVIADLMVDRSILFENLRVLSVWLEQENIAKGEGAQTAYDASRCLQCGCCLEICPNFYPGGDFFGMAGFAPAARLIAQLPEEKRQSLCKAYRRHVYEGCGKSLACRKVCPAGLPIDALLVNTNAAAVWKNPFRRKR